MPNCGLYRTARALAGQEEQVPSGILVMFHNHSEQGPPIVLRPVANEDNRWKFHDRGWSVNDQSFLEALVSLKPEGFYTVTGQIYVEREQRIANRTLVQVGYNRNGDTIIFPAEFVGNSIHFPNRGYRFESPGVQQHLTPVSFATPSRKTLH